jgi:hypothetical protein
MNLSGETSPERGRCERVGGGHEGKDCYKLVLLRKRRQELATEFSLNESSKQHGRTLLKRTMIGGNFFERISILCGPI